MNKIFILLFLLIGTKAAAQYQNTTWGMSQLEVKNLVKDLRPDKFFSDRLSNITYINDDNAGYIYTGYDFKNDNLTSVVVHYVHLKDTNREEVEKYLQHVVLKQLITKYGEPETSFGILNIWKLRDMIINTGVINASINNDKPTIMLIYKRNDNYKNLNDVL